MKKTITGVVALLAGAFVAHSQGTVSFGNAYALSSYIYVSLGATKLGGTTTATTGVPANDTGNGNDWTVALYGGLGTSLPASSLTPATTDGTTPVTATLENGVDQDNVAGTWISTTVAEIPGTTFANQAATVQIYAWYNDGGTITSYGAAQTAGVPTGFSATGNVLTGGPQQGGGTPLTAPSLPSGLGNVTLTSTVPEPSTIALGVMGASAFLMRLRKKQ